MGGSIYPNPYLGPFLPTNQTSCTFLLHLFLDLVLFSFSSSFFRIFLSTSFFFLQFLAYLIFFYHLLIGDNELKVFFLFSKLSSLVVAIFISCHHVEQQTFFLRFHFFCEKRTLKRGEKIVKEEEEKKKGGGGGIKVERKKSKKKK